MMMKGVEQWFKRLEGGIHGDEQFHAMIASSVGGVERERIMGESTIENEKGLSYLAKGQAGDQMMGGRVPES